MLAKTQPEGLVERPLVTFPVFISHSDPELMYVRTVLVKLRVTVLSIIDPGARFTLINEKYKEALDKVKEGPTAMIRGVGSYTATTGSGDCELLLEGGIGMKAHAHLFPNLPVPLLIGMKELYDNAFRIDFRKREVTMEEIQIPVVRKEELKQFTDVMHVDAAPSKLVLTAPASPLGEESSDDRTERLMEVLEKNTMQEITEPDLRSKLKTLLREFAHTFAMEDETLRSCKFTAPRLEFLQDNVVVRSKCYTYAQKERDFIKKQVDDWVSQNICIPYTSDFASPVVVVARGHKDGELVRPRLCIDYSKLNSFLRPNLHPLPTIDYLLSKLEGAKYFCSLDLRRGYLQVKVPHEDLRYLTFITPFGCYSCLRLPFGLTTAPGVFQNFIDTTMNGVPNVLVYLNDLLVYGSSVEELLWALRGVLAALDRDGWQISATKCTFGAKRVKILGHLVSAAGIEMDPSKIESITKFTPPTNVSKLRAFLGLCSYYRKFIHLFSAKTKPLTMLLQKDVEYVWGQAQQQAFEELKRALVSAPILRHFNPSLPIFCHSDSSNFAIGGALTQKKHGKENAVAYCSRSLTPAEQKLSTIDKEFLALVYVCEKFRPFLYLQKFTMYVDHAPLQILENSCTIKNAKLLRWKLRLSEYNFTIVHRPGRKHLLRDALSRMEPDVNEGAEADPYAMPPNIEQLLPEPPAFWNETDTDWFEWQQADEVCKLFREVAKSQRSKYREIDGIVYRMEGEQPRILVPLAKRQEVLKSCHDHPLSGHLGQKVTWERVKSKFWWPKCKQSVIQYVKSCDSCQRAKRPVRKPPGLTSAIPPPHQIGDFIAMDFAGPLSNTAKGNKYIILAIDLLSKFVHGKAVPEANADQVILFFTETILAVQGPPKFILTDNGTCFLAYKTQNAFRSQGCKLINSSAWHPQAHGIIERQFSTLKAALRAYIQDTAMSQWDIYLPSLLYALNSSYKDAIKATPYEVVYCKKPRSPFEVQLPRLARLKDQDRARQAAVMREQARLAILRAQKIFQARSNQRRESVSYEPGDLVLLKKGMAPRGVTEKLYCFWRGPYLVLEVTSPVNVKIALPNEIDKAQIVHVERVKRYYTREPDHDTVPQILDGTVPASSTHDSSGPSGGEDSDSDGEDDDGDDPSSSGSSSSDSDSDKGDKTVIQKGTDKGNKTVSRQSTSKGGKTDCPQGVGGGLAPAPQAGDEEDAGSEEVEVGSEYPSAEEEDDEQEPNSPNISGEQRGAGRGRGLSPYTTKSGRISKPPDRFGQ